MHENQWKVDELKKCREDPLYFFATYCKTHKAFGYCAHFDITPHFLEMYDSYINHNKCVITQTRQKGVSTFCMAMILWHMIFDDSTKEFSYIMDTKRGSSHVSDRLVLMYNGLPPWMARAQWTELSSSRLVTDTGNYITIYPPSPTMFCSMHNDVIIFDNAFAYQQNIKQFVQDALIQQPKHIVVVLHELDYKPFDNWHTSRI